MTDRHPSPFDPPDMVRSTAGVSPYASSIRSTHVVDQGPDSSFRSAPPAPLLPAVPQYLHSAPPPSSIGNGNNGNGTGGAYILPSVSNNSSTSNQESTAGYGDFGGAAMNFNPMLNNGISPIYPAGGFDGFGFGVEETPEGLFDWGQSVLLPRLRLESPDETMWIADQWSSFFSNVPSGANGMPPPPL